MGPLGPLVESGAKLFHFQLCEQSCQVISFEVLVKSSVLKQQVAETVLNFLVTLACVVAKIEASVRSCKPHVDG